ncbi:hypothetical protein Q7P37_000644 [Cladosporium fusiforme]
MSPDNTNPTTSCEGLHCPPSPSTTESKASSSRPPTPPSALISELVCDYPDYFTEPPNPFANLHASKHNPDFRVRNQLKFFKVSSILSGLRFQLFAAERTQDQAAFDALYARIVKAGEGLESLTSGLGESVEEMGLGGEDGGFGEIMRVDRKGDWWHVVHGSAAEEGEMHDELSRERVKAAKSAYEEGLPEIQLLSGDEHEMEQDGGVHLAKDANDENWETNLVSDKDDLQENDQAASTKDLDDE